MAIAKATTPAASSLTVDNSAYIIRGTAITLETRGNGRWAVVLGNRCLNLDGDFEYEPRPSSRDEYFIKRTRFPDANDALKALKSLWPRVSQNPEVFNLSGFRMDEV
jgi:hypothetical protein